MERQKQEVKNINQDIIAKRLNLIPYSEEQKHLSRYVYEYLDSGEIITHENSIVEYRNGKLHIERFVKETPSTNYYETPLYIIDDNLYVEK